MSARHIVIGTAGHIDHGKSALVQALTGVDPDRLKEEKRRGITIELGFADLALDATRVLSFVDVPGHERFVRHMVAGATGFEAVLLVVAADQGVQPQTVEHLEICGLLGLGAGAVALTKCDLVDEELEEVARLELGEALRGSFLEDAPIVPVSARTGKGLDDLRETLGALFDQVRPTVGARGVVRLPVDRSFVLKGFGTVVTGTLVSGELKEGDELEVLPGGRRGRVRGLQVHRTAVTSTVSGRRTAVNLQGLDCASVPRGSTLTTPGALSMTHRLWARVELLPRAPQGLHHGGPVRFHQGTCERGSRFRVLQENDDESLVVELYLDEATVLAPGDRFVLRRPAPVDTVGGGVVLDAHPPRARRPDAAGFDQEHLIGERAVVTRLERAGLKGRAVAELGAELGVEARELEARLDGLAADGIVVRQGARWLLGTVWRLAAEGLVEALETFHASEPLKLGMSREALRAKVAPELAAEGWRSLLEGVREAGRIRLEGDRVALEGHRVKLDAGASELATQIETRFLDAGLDPPGVEALAGSRGEVGEIVDLLVAQGTLVRIHDGKLFHARALVGLKERLAAHARSSPTISVGEFKELAGVTRKNAIPLLEHLDAVRVTRRAGNLREILVRSPEAAP